MVEINKVAYEGTHRTHIRFVREHVFVQEQHIAPEIEFDALDAEAIHVLVMAGDQPVGTGRMLKDGHIGRIAIMPAARGQGLGAKVVQTLVSHAKQQGYLRVDLGAQAHAVEFYRKLGFTPCGDPFLEANIPHQGMEQRLR